MEKGWLKLEGGAVEDDLPTGQVRAVLPNPPEESASTEPRAVGRASEGRLPELGVGGGVAGQGWEERQRPGRAPNSWDARGVRERIGGRSASN